MREWVFRWRGYVLMPSAILVLLLCRPTLRSFSVGLMVALCGEALRVWGVGYSGLTTRSSKVEARHLVTAGPYAHTRNPLYLGNFTTAIGFCMVAAGGWGWGMRIVSFVLISLLYISVYALIIPLEEKYLMETFGESYRTYKREVPRLWPRMTPYRLPSGRFDWRAIQHGEVHSLALFLLVGSVMAMKLVMTGMLNMILGV